MPLRDYQRNAVDKTLEFIDSKKSKAPGYIIAPSGCGKSHIIAGLTHELAVPTLVFQPSREILLQNLGKYTDYGHTASVWSASLNQKERENDVVFSTIGSAYKHPEILEDVGLIVIDECHNVPPDKLLSGRDPVTKKRKRKQSMYGQLLQHYKGPVVGLTATPTRLWTGNNPFTGQKETMSKMLHRIKPRVFSHVIDVIQIPELVTQGYWTKPLYDVRDFDTTYLAWNTTRSDYTEASILKALEANETREEAVKAAKKAHTVFGRRHVLIFTVSVKDAQWIAGQLGERAAYLHAETPAAERRRILRDFKAGDLSYVANVEVLTTGFDFPSLDCILLGRPTQSYALYYQMVGRGVRPFQSKPNCLVVDLVNNFSTFGPIEEMRVEDHPVHGWGIYLGRRIITRVPVGQVKYVQEPPHPLPEESEDGAPEKKLAPPKKIPMPPPAPANVPPPPPPAASQPPPNRPLGRGKWGNHTLDKIPRSYLEYIYTNWARVPEDEWIFQYIEKRGIAGIATDETLMPFGKYGPHNGDHRMLKDVPADYLLWLHGTGVRRQDLRRYIEDNLDVLQKEVNKAL